MLLATSKARCRKPPAAWSTHSEHAHLHKATQMISTFHRSILANKSKQGVRKTAAACSDARCASRQRQVITKRVSWRSPTVGCTTVMTSISTSTLPMFFETSRRRLLYVNIVPSVVMSSYERPLYATLCAIRLPELCFLQLSHVISQQQEDHGADLASSNKLNLPKGRPPIAMISYVATSFLSKNARTQERSAFRQPLCHCILTALALYGSHSGGHAPDPRRHSSAL